MDIVSDDQKKELTENLFGGEDSAVEVPAEEIPAEAPAVTEDPEKLKRIADFKEFISQTIADRAAKIESPDTNRNDNRIFGFLCEDRTLNAERCADKFSATYGGNPSVNRFEKFFRDYLFDKPEKRKEFFDWAASAVGTFLKALETGNNKEFKSYNDCYKKRLPSVKGKSRIFFSMLYHRHPELFPEDVFAKLEILDNDCAREVHDSANSWLRKICNPDNLPMESESERRLRRKLNEAQDENARLQAQLKKTRDELKELQAKFDGSRSELVKFLSELNSSFKGRILDEIVNAYKAVKTLRKNNIPVPPEVKKLLPFAIHLAQFGHEKKFDYVIDIRKSGTVREMTNGEIESCHGIYHGTEFKSNTEVKRVKIISPGWKYEDKIISLPEFQECSDSED